jgi:hypothetical protein
VQDHKLVVASASISESHVISGFLYRSSCLECPHDATVLVLLNVLLTLLLSNMHQTVITWGCVDTFSLPWP